jgi:WD40 repeat protein
LGLGGWSSLKGGLVRWWRFLLLTVAGVLTAVAGTVLAVAVNVATGGTARGLPWIEGHPWWWSAGSTLAVAGAGLVVWWAQRMFEPRSAGLVPVVRRPESWVVDRPVEVDRIVGALRARGGAATVGITTAVYGAGGFGKTTVAQLVRADRRVLRWFGGRVYWVTLGRDVRKDALVEKVNDLVRQVDAGRAQPFTDLRQAGEHLAAVLAAGPRRLVVLDDVWFDYQLAAFPVVGRCARLVTTRVPSLVAGPAVSVKVDQMSVAQSRAVLTAGLPQLPPDVVDGMLTETARWALLLRLVNRILMDQARLRTDVGAVARELLDRLRRTGALQVDQLSGAAVQQLDVNDPDQRQRAIAATIEASMGLLGGDERDRFAELAVFAEDEAVPVALVAALWQATGGVDVMATRALCARLADLALLTLTRTGEGGTIGVHDVLRDFLHEELGSERLRHLHQLLLRTVAAELPRAPTAEPIPGGTHHVAWWELPESARYLWEHLIEHLLAGGCDAEAEALATDLRWVGNRLEQAGPAGPIIDLSAVDTPATVRLRRLFGQTAHLLTATNPAHSRIDILYSRVAHDHDWGRQVRELLVSRTLPALVTQWPLPDLPDPASRRTLTGHAGEALAVAIAPNGTWLASGDEAALRIWHAGTGRPRTELTGHSGGVLAVAIAPDGSWLASGDYGSVRIWDVATGRQRARLTGHSGWVRAVAIAPDGSWLASAGDDRAVRIWDTATGRQRTPLTRHTGGVWALAIGPDGGWLAYAGGDQAVRICDTATGRQRSQLTGHTGGVWGLAIAPDGGWLACAGGDGAVRTWDIASGRQRERLTGHTGVVRAVAIAPNGTWLASAGDDRSVRIWDAATGRQRAGLTGHTGAVLAVAIAPDGDWLASGSDDGSVRIWDAGPAQRRIEPTGHAQVVHGVAIAPDGSWLATAGPDGTVRIWDAATGRQRTRLSGHSGVVRAVAIAQDGGWLASAGADGTVRIWDAATGRQRTRLTRQTGVVRAVAIAPDGSWLASAGDNGSVRIWEAGTGARRTELMGHSGGVLALAIAPDGNWLASAGYDSVQIWDIGAGRQRATMTGHRRGVLALAIAPDGNWLASAGADGTVRIWDAATGRQRTRLSGHTGAVRAVAVAADGTRLASGGADGSLRIWDVATGEPSAMTRVEQPILACAWDPRDESLVAGGNGGLYRFAFRP